MEIILGKITKVIPPLVSIRHLAEKEFEGGTGEHAALKEER
jgi:hypothetical protein